MIGRRWFVAGGHRMHARTAGAHTSNRRRDAVLVHGLGVSSRYMVPTLRALSADRACWAVDLPGFGLSSKPRKVLDVGELAEALGAWVDAADIGEPLIVANSFGCQVAVEYARRTERPSALVLVGPTTDAAARSWRGQATRWVVNGFREPLSLGAVLVRDYLDCGLRRPAGTFRYALEDRIEDHITGCDAPILIVRGERDPIAPLAWCERLRERAQQAEVVEVAGAAHTVNYSHPDRLVRELRRFLRSRT